MNSLDFYCKKYFATKAEEERKYFLESMSTEELAMFCKASDILRKQDELRGNFQVNYCRKNSGLIQIYSLKLGG